MITTLSAAAGIALGYALGYWWGRYPRWPGDDRPWHG